MAYTLLIPPSEYINTFFPDAKGGPEQYRDKCPVCHKDDHLYISFKEKKVLLYCQGPECQDRTKSEDFAKAMGISLHKLLTGKDKEEPHIPKIVETRVHYYENADGSSFGRKIIKKDSDGKKHCYWERYENGTYISGLNGKVAPIFDLDRLVESESDTVYIAEGEKDSNRINDMDLTGTTFPNGGNQKKWDDSYNEPFKGKAVMILTDNDATGAEYGIFVASHLYGIAKSIKIIPATAIYPESGPKFDISDIVHEIGEDEAKSALLKAVKAAPEYVPEIEAIPENDNKPSTKSSGNQSRQLTLSAFEEMIENEGISFRYNLITHSPDIVLPPEIREYCGGNLQGNALITLIWDFVKQKYSCSEACIQSYIFLAAMRRRWNPVQVMLEENPWDGISRKEELYNILNLEPDDNFSKMLIEKWLRQCIAMALNDENNPYGADGILVLNGLQGIGKTSFGRLLGMRNPMFFKEGKAIDPKDKDEVIRGTSAWIVEMGELEATFRKADQERLKAFITMDVDEYRPPYARTNQREIRRTSFLATCNSDEFLTDDTGSRRYWIISVSDIDLPAMSAFDSQQLWAEIYHDCLQADSMGVCFRLTKEERTELQERNGKHQRKPKAYEEVRDIIENAKDILNNRHKYQWKKITVSEFKMMHPTLSKYDVSQIGRALREYGIEPIEPRSERGYLYRLPIMTNENYPNFDSN